MKKLEEHKGFSILAWLLIFGFSLFTYHLTTQVSALEERHSGIRTESAIDDLDTYFE